MPSQRTYDEAVAAALDNATVDRKAEPGQRVRFEQVTLSRVVELFKGSGGARGVKFAWRDEWNAAVDGLDLDRSLAVLALQDRLTGARDRRYVEVDGRWAPAEQGPGEGPGEAASDEEVRESLSWSHPEEFA